MTDRIIHPIAKGAWCVPSAIQALTGQDYDSVIHPALNRHSGAARTGWLTDMVVSSHMSIAAKVLDELGYNVRRFVSKAELPLGVTVKTWAERSATRWPGRAVLIAVPRHALVVSDGKVYDNNVPFGETGERHPYAKCIVNWAALVEKRNG